MASEVLLLGPRSTPTIHHENMFFLYHLIDPETFPSPRSDPLYHFSYHSRSEWGDFTFENVRPEDRQAKYEYKDGGCGPFMYELFVNN